MTSRREVIVCVELVLLATGKVPPHPGKCGMLECHNEGRCDQDSSKCVCTNEDTKGDDCSIIDEGSICSGGIAKFTMTLTSSEQYSNTIEVMGSNSTHPCFMSTKVGERHSSFNAAESLLLLYTVTVQLKDVSKPKPEGCAAHVKKDVRKYTMLFILKHDKLGAYEFELSCTQPIGRQ